MKKIFYIGIAGLVLFEIANVYFIMPMPGSQRMESLDAAYFLYQWRWVFRTVFGGMIAAGLLPAFRASRWKSGLALAALALIVYQVNLEMAAEKMFLQPRTLQLADAQNNRVNLDKLVLGIERNGEAKAYPVQFIGYHHQVPDQVGGKPILVTYCTVCRSGRVFAPEVDGQKETFRLVGMDHFNAMLEDATTGSWWRQATGEAVAGPRKGMQLPELACTQTTLREWLLLHPTSQVMQPDAAFAEEYADMESYDTGLGRGKLTGTDTLSWKPKSWVVGIALDAQTAKAYDWNRLKEARVVNDQVGEQPIVLALAADGKSFFAFERPDTKATFTLQHDTLFSAEKSWNLDGEPIRPGDEKLVKVTAYQEFWHSWTAFHPYTTRY